jgi:hypothetical protein
MKTHRGFEILHFIDDSGFECSLQESSDIDPHIWLGIDQPRIIIMQRDAIAVGLDLPKMPGYENTGDGGWCEITLPDTALIQSRMNLTPEQARILAEQLLFFADNEYLKPSEKSNLWEIKH